MSFARSVGRAAAPRRDEDADAPGSDQDEDVDMDQHSGPEERPKEKPDAKQNQEPKKPRRVAPPRPKLTMELLEGPKGFDDVFSKFPDAFRLGFKGKGHEIGDLQRLLEMYSRWQQRVFPHKSFDEFIVALEKMSGTAAVKVAMRQRRTELLNLVLMPEAEAEAEAEAGDVGAGGARGEEDRAQHDMDAWPDDDDGASGGGDGGGGEPKVAAPSGAAGGGAEGSLGVGTGDGVRGGRRGVGGSVAGARAAAPATAAADDDDEGDDLMDEDRDEFADCMDAEERRRQDAEDAALEALGDEGGWGDEDEAAPPPSRSGAGVAAGAAAVQRRSGAGRGAEGAGRLVRGQEGRGDVAAHDGELEDELEGLGVEVAAKQTAGAAQELGSDQALAAAAAELGSPPLAAGADDGLEDAPAAAPSEQDGGSGKGGAGAACAQEPADVDDEELVVGTSGTQGRLTSRVRQVLMDEDEDED